VKPRQLGLVLAVVFVVVIAIYNGSKRHTSQTDQSDLTIAASSATITPGQRGEIDVRVGNSGPDAMHHTVTFTVTAGPHLAITGGGQVAAQQPDVPFFPDTDCELRKDGRVMTCVAYVSLGVSHHLRWQVPVRVAAGAPATATLRLTVNAAGNSLYTDPHGANNTAIGFAVHAGPPGSEPTTGRAPSSHAPPSSHPPSSSNPLPAPSSGHPSGAPSTTSTTGAKKIQNAATKALVPVTIALWLVVGFVAMIVGALVLVSRRQQEAPLDYIPPRREKSH
jgi:hypothetical protein